jgi:predicted lactoylglutathione lyase
MPRMIFVNLPVTDLAASMTFYAGLGFVNEPRFTDDTAACMQWSDTIAVMLLTHAKWKSFTSRPIPSPDHSEVMNCLSLDSRDEVNRLADIAAGSGARESHAAEDHGFMMSRNFADPDGHVWEFMWMDPAVANGDGPVPGAA